MAASFYSSAAWKRARALVLARDGFACSVVEHDGDAPCGVRSGLSVHHFGESLAEIMERGGDPLDLDGLATVCRSHHAAWEYLMRTRRAGREARTLREAA